MQPLSSRSSEIFRRLGLAHKLRDTGLPADYPERLFLPHHGNWHRASRASHPCRRDRYTPPADRIRLPTAERRTASTDHMEPVLFAHAADIDGLQILNRTEFWIQRRNDGIVATVRNLDTGTTSQIVPISSSAATARARSSAQAIDANLQERRSFQRVQSTYIHAPALLALMDAPAWMTLSLNPRRRRHGGRDRRLREWLIHNHLNRETRPSSQSIATPRSAPSSASARISNLRS